jgi:DNA-binding MarR family transcriptional regulator
LSRALGTKKSVSEEIARRLRRGRTCTLLLQDAVADRLGINVTDLVCGDIILEDAPVSAGRLAQRSGLTTGAITGVLNRLENAKLVRRIPDTADARRVLVDPISARIPEIDALYDNSRNELDRLCERYTVAELRAIREFLGSLNELMHHETMRLRFEETVEQQKKTSS